jgi:hypothetical protein
MTSTTSGNDFNFYFAKVGSFAANLVQAENVQEMEQAIEAVALPVGSATIKKKTDWSISLNGYLGGFTGKEYLANKLTNKEGSIAGVYCPLGVAINKGIGSASLSAFLSVIDLGAVASFRLENDSTALLPDLKLQNILAPGAGIILGLPKWPLSIGWTYQLGPVLRDIEAGQAVLDEKANNRWQVFLAVDIPIVHFYTKSRDIRAN